MRFEVQLYKEEVHSVSHDWARDEIYEDSETVEVGYPELFLNLDDALYEAEAATRGEQMKATVKDKNANKVVAEFYDGEVDDWDGQTVTREMLQKMRLMSNRETKSEQKTADGFDGAKFKVGDPVRTSPGDWRGTQGNWEARGVVTKVDKNEYGWGEAPEYIYSVRREDANSDQEVIGITEDDIEERMLVQGQRKTAGHFEAGDRVREKASGAEGTVVDSESGIDRQGMPVEVYQVKFDGEGGIPF